MTECNRMESKGKYNNVKILCIVIGGIKLSMRKKMEN